MDTQTLTTAVDLMQRRQVFHQLKGNKWPGIVAEYEVFICQRMAVEKCEVLAAALGLAKMLSDACHDPNELLAAAVEIILRDAKQKGKTHG
jgi:hypothetical protein